MCRLMIAQNTNESNEVKRRRKKNTIKFKTFKIWCLTMNWHSECKCDYDYVVQKALDAKLDRDRTDEKKANYNSKIHCE